MLLHPKQAAGFTLIELSIVLVIIGLIVGGVLVGQELIHAAEMRGQGSQVEEINAAVNTFRLKYNCLPGDCRNATTFFAAGSQPTQVTNGDGDKQIAALGSTAGLCQSAMGMEWIYVFDHLAAAGLYQMSQYDETLAANNRAGYAYPKCKLRSKGIVNDPNPIGSAGHDDCGVRVGFEWGQHVIRLGVHPFGNWTANVYNSAYAGFTPPDAHRYDMKFDDGKPASGAVQVAMTSPYNCQPGPGDSTSANVAGCADWNNNIYSIANTDYRYCSLRIRAQF